MHHRTGGSDLREPRNTSARRRRLIAASAVSALLLLLASCASVGTAGKARKEAGLPEQKPGTAADLSKTQLKIVEGARELTGAKRLVVKGRKFRMDCTGAVAAAYWYAGVDILGPLAKYRGNGVLRLYRFMEEEGLLVSADEPAPGDIIFWDNTYDRNDDGSANDTLTHTGIVVSTDEDGTVVYYHHNYRRGIVLERMNIADPDIHTKMVNDEQVVVNAPMRMRGSPDFDLWLAAQLLRSYGRAWRISQ